MSDVAGFKDDMVVFGIQSLNLTPYRYSRITEAKEIIIVINK